MSLLSPARAHVLVLPQASGSVCPSWMSSTAAALGLERPDWCAFGTRARGSLSAGTDERWHGRFVTGLSTAAL